MTRHNLAIHISWLLSTEVALPPVGDPTVTASIAAVDVAYADLEEEDTKQQTSRVLANSRLDGRIVQTVNVGNDFLRPAIPSTITPKLPLQEPPNRFADQSMGKLSSASRSSRPGLTSQHQLATPASTLGSTRSLMQGYSQQLRGNCTSSSKSSIERIPPHFPRSLQTPQTPKQTPRPTSRLKLESVESVDLTGDDNNQNPSSRSSSTEMGFGESQMVWREDYASRPEPLPRSSKKRKSNEISKEQSPTKNTIGRSPRKAKKEERADSEGFMDIDDMVTIHQPQDQSRGDEPCAKSVKASIEYPASRDEVEEESSVTETVIRTETRTRKSMCLSRIPSGRERPVTAPKLKTPPLLPSTGSHANSGSIHSSKLRSIIRATASPTPEDSHSHQTSQKRNNFRFDTIIQDSDDEEIVSEERQFSLSPRFPVKSSPGTFNSPKSPLLENIQAFEQPGCEGTHTGAKPRVGSPLRPISLNIGIKQDNVPSPFQKDSPTRLSATPKHLPQQTSQETPYTLPPNEKKMLSLFLNQPSSITSYHLRVKNLIKQNAVISMSFMDEKIAAPAALVQERKELLDMNKGYEALERLGELYKSTMAEKKNLARNICELLDIGIDTSAQEERSSVLTKEIQRIEKETGHLLHASGAIKDGFGTGPAAQDELAELSTKARDSHGSLLHGSSTAGSAQIIFQTQFASQPRNPAASLNPPAYNDFAPEPKSGVGLKEAAYTSVDLGQRSPAPIRLSPPRFLAEPYQTPNLQNSRQSPGVKQPNFYRDPQSNDYGFDGDDDLLGLLEDEEEILQITGKKIEVLDGIKDDYGDFDDDDDMLNIAQEIEQRHSLTGSSGMLHRDASFKASASRPELPKRTSPKAGKNMYSLVEPTADLLKHSWSRDVRRALKDRFKLNGFRHHQLEAINATLSGRDTFVLMPTGGGKSLCYQLPAVVQSGKTKGVTIVISPLLSLMTDQVAHLRKNNIQASTLNGEVSTVERNEVMSYLGESHPEQFIQLLYITPEMITKSDRLINALSALHRNRKLARIVIDEAHCVSQWGHDFRPDYVALGGLRKRFQGVPFMALTATATENVKVDVMHNLSMGDALVLPQSFNRPNLHYEVRSKKGKGVAKEILADIADLIKSTYPNQTGIIYTLSRKNCEQLAQQLKDNYKIKAHHYHASMSPDDKKAIQLDWQSGKIKVVVATIAFGMGIDKPDVRFVIHHTIPKSLEGYYQETGRAGRDGKKSGCYLYYGYQDTAVLKNFIYQSEGSHEQKERQRMMLSSMVQYCENRSDCRRVQVLAYFGEAFSKEECESTCDNCNSDAVFESHDLTAQARSAMNIVKQIQNQHVTLLHCVDILRGSASKKVKELEHEKLPEYGAAEDIARGELERLFYRLVMENALEERNVINRSGFANQYLNLGPNCRDFITGRRKLKLLVKVSMSPAGGLKQKLKKPAKNPPRSGTAVFPSTALTSPLSEATRRRQPASHRKEARIDDYGYIRDDFIASEDEDDVSYFEPVQDRRLREEMPGDELGPPITIDERMENLPELHRVFIHQFLDEANKEVQRLRNWKNLKKPIFTEANLREMAINWTVTLDDMRKLPDINAESVTLWGKYFIAIVEKFSANYEVAMNDNEDRDMDKNHQNVIDLCSDDEEDEGSVLDDDDEEAILQAERSQYFSTPGKASSSSNHASSSRALPLPTESSTKSVAPRKSSRGGNSYRPRGNKAKSHKPTSGRRSYSSAYGQGRAGVTKRKTSGGARKSAAAKGKGTSDLFATFGNHGSRGGRGGGSIGGGGIGMMPT